MNSECVVYYLLLTFKIKKNQKEGKMKKSLFLLLILKGIVKVDHFLGWFFGSINVDN